MTSSALEQFQPAGPPAVRGVHGTAIAVRLPLPLRRSTLPLAITGALAVGSGVAGAATTVAGSTVGPWLVVNAGLTGLLALLGAADLHRSRA